MQNTKRLGRQTVMLQTPPIMKSTSAIAGSKEGEGPLRDYYDYILEDSLYGETTWEKAESKMLKTAVELALTKAGLAPTDIDYILAGDLLNQCVGTHYAMRDIEIPLFGLYGACSTFAQSLGLASMLIDGGFANNAIAATSSHFCSAEKQFRFPLEYGGQRPPTAQWTVTGAGACVLSKEGAGPRITHVTTGKIVDVGIKDANNMGTAMAPAAADTIMAHFEDTGLNPDSYSLILSGDLGELGKKITNELLLKNGLNIASVYNDCGCLVFDNQSQDTHSGGSGCACSAIAIAGRFYKGLSEGKYERILLVGTGALMSPTTTQQGESIPGIAHAVALQRG